MIFHSSVSIEDFMDNEILTAFIEEAESYLPTIRGGILVSRGKSAGNDELKTALRQVHTIKGAAQMVGLDELGTISSELENDLNKAFTEDAKLSDENVRMFLDKFTAIETLIAKVSFESNDDEVNIDKFVEDFFENLESSPDQKENFGKISTETFAEIPDTESRIEEISADDEFSGWEEEFEIDDEMLEIFALEAEDLLRNINTHLEVLENAPNNRESLLEIRRNAHTLKGSAGIVGLKKLSELAHKVEDLLDYLAENDVASNVEIFEFLLTSTDCFSQLANSEDSEQLTKKTARIYKNFEKIMASLPANAVQNSAVSEAETKTETPIAPAETSETAEQKNQPQSNQNRSIVRVSLDKLDELVKIVSGLIISRSVFEQRLGEFEQQIAELSNSTRRLQHSTNKLETDFEADMLGNAKHFQTSFTAGQKKIEALPQTDTAEFDILEFDRYTEFHQTTRELLETSADTTATNSELDVLRGKFEMLFENQRRLVEEMQDKILRLRMVRFGTLSVRLHRTIRVTCEEEGKCAELSIEGDNLEVDTQILDSLVEPLLHLLRNAVAHGIESPETRRLLGKRENGKISLSVHSEGTHIIVKIADDGRGIAPSALKEKAVQDKFITEAQAEKLTEEEIFELMFLPGLTTAGKISHISGRGVGMNIVKSSIARYQGTISINSEIQKGTTFTVRLPMALAVTRSLLVKANEQTFAFPLKLIKKITEISQTEYEQAKRAKSLNILDKEYQLSNLNDLLKYPVKAFSENKKIPVLLLDRLEKPCALIVDEIIKPEEIVIKPLGNPLQNLEELLGATILGNGDVVPVLDLIYLLKNKSSAGKIQKSAVQTKIKKQPTVMIVDDSPSVRKINSKLVEKNKWKSIIAKDGLEALEILQVSGEMPDVILTDVEMPRMDGYELLATLRRQPILQNIPVIMITSRSGEKHRQKAFDLGVSEYLTKPYEDSALVGSIKNLAKI